MITRRVGEQRWMASALCARFPTLPWTADPGPVPSPAEESMRLVCALCPVQRECGTFVIAERIDAGFWAGSHRGHAPGPTRRAA